MSSIGPDETSYFLLRAEQQLELAQRADHAQVVSAHYELANLYLDIAYADPAAVASADPVIADKAV